MEHSKGGLSVAMIISIIGWLSCAFLAGTGLYIWGWKLIWALIVTIAILLLGGIGSFFAIQAKKAKSDFNNWHKKEIGGRIMMFVALILLVMPFCLGLNYFFERSELTRAANNDQNSINMLIDQYKTQELQRLNHTTQGLLNYAQSHSNNTSAKFKEYITNEVMANQSGNINDEVIYNYKDLKYYLIENGAIDANPIEARRATIDSILSVAHSYKLDKYKSVQADFDEASQNLADFLTQMSASLDLPVISSSTGMFIISDSRPDTYEAPKSSFGDEYAKVFDFSWLTFLITLGAFLVLALLSFTHYLCEYRPYVLNDITSITDEDGLLL